MKNVLKKLAKSVSIPLGLTAAVSVIDATIRNKIFESSVTLVIFSKKISRRILVIKKKVWVKQFQMKQKNKKTDFLGFC